MIKGIFLASILACSVVNAETTYLKLDSEPGDILGQGIIRVYQDDAETGVKLNIRTALDQLIIISTRYRTQIPNEDRWEVVLGAPNGEKLTVKKYENTSDYPDYNPQSATLSVSGAGLDCGGGVHPSNFEILEAVYTDSGVLDKLAAKFEYHCYGRPEALRGSVYVNSSLVATDLEPRVKVDVNGKTKIVEAKVGEPVTVSVNVGANAKTNATVETWVGLLTPNRNKWFNGAGWTELDKPYIASIDFLNDKKQTFTITPKVPGPHLFIYAIDEGVNNKMDVQYSGQIVINAK